jgi:hypothetical protein
MTDNRKSGIALIGGSLGGIVTMAMHRVAQGSLTTEQVAHLMTLSGAARSLAMVSTLLLFLGSCGLARSVATADRIAFAGIATFGFACVAALIAAAVSGFTVPSLIDRMAHDAAGAAHQWQIVVTGIFQINQAFARIYSVATSMAIILWSVSALRNGGCARGVAIYGCIISPLIIFGDCRRPLAA